MVEDLKREQMCDDTADVATVPVPPLPHSFDGGEILPHPWQPD